MLTTNPFYHQVLSHISDDKDYYALSDRDKNKLTGEWLLSGCPGSPNTAMDYFSDAMVSPLTLCTLVAFSMSGEVCHDEIIVRLIHQSLREECKKHIVESWELIAERMEAA